MTDQKKKLLDNFSVALGELVSAGLSDLDPEKAQAVSVALQARTATIQLAVSTDPMVIACFLRSRDVSMPMHPLFRIEIGGDAPSGTTQ